MSRAQRLTFLGIAAIIAVVAVIVLSGGGGETDKAADATATPTPSTSEATATPTPKPKPPLLRAGKVKTLTYDKGDTVRFRVRSPQDDEVHVHGYDIPKDVKAGGQVSFSFPANLEGVFEVELESRKEQIAELRVNP